MPAANVHRTDSLRSERSDASQNNKRVSFNNDVDVKHIPRGAVVDRHGKLVGYLPPGDTRRLVHNIYREPAPLSEEEIAREAEKIIQQVDQISCSVSATPGAYDTRSLERKSKKNNQQDLEKKNWSKTLPSSSTKNKLEGKSNNVIEKNVLNSNQVNVLAPTVQLDPILETSREALSGDLTTSMEYKDNFTPKYDSGIEMEAQLGSFRPQSEKPQLGRNNVNLIVKQLTEESRHRDHLRKKYEQDGIDKGPRMPVLSVVEPDPSTGLTHNRNLPFSYLDGSPTRRGSPPRPLRPSPPRKLDPSDRHLKNDIIYAQVVVEDSQLEATRRKIHNSLNSPKEQSPERNFYLSSKGIVEKVPANGKLFKSSNFQSKDRYKYDKTEKNEDDDIDAIKAKAKFLFGDDGHLADEYRYRYDDYIQEPSSLSFTDTTDSASRNRYNPVKPGAERNAATRNITEQNNYRNEESKTAGVSYKYSSLLNDRAERQTRDLTTKVLISTEPERHKERIFRYSEDEDYKNGPQSYDYFVRTKELSSSPEPISKQQTRAQPKISVRDRIRTYEVQSPESSPEREFRFTVDKPQEVNFRASKLVQEAERGRTVTRANVPSSRLTLKTHQQRPYNDNNTQEEPPKPPLRTKKLKDRLEQNSPPRNDSFRRITVERNQNNNYEHQARKWNRSSPEESSPERFQFTIDRRSPVRYEPRVRLGGSDHRRENSEEYIRDPNVRYYQKDKDYNNERQVRDSDARQRSLSSSPERINVRITSKVSKPSDIDTRAAKTAVGPEKQEKIKRQRSKFLSVFLGSGKQNKTKENQTKEQYQNKGHTQQEAAVREQRDPSWEEAARRSQGKSKYNSKGQYQAKWHEGVDTDYSGNVRREEASSKVKQTQVRETQHEREAKGRKETKGQVERVKWEADLNDEPRQTAKKNLRSSESFHVREARNRPVSPYRSDTSESQDDRAVPMKYARHKSQSYSNLHARQERDFNDDDNNYNHWNSATLNRLEVRQRREEPRAYASADVIRDQRDIRAAPIERTRSNVQERAPQVRDQNLRYFGDTDLESQQSGGRYPRYASKAKVMRSASSAAGMGGVRKSVMARQSARPVVGVSNSLQTNSSESEVGSQASNMVSGASAESGASQRSVYLHATTVADIPPATLLSQRRRAQSRDDLSQLQQPQPLPQRQGAASPNSALRKTRQLSRSYSVLTPWKPRNVREKYEVSYSNPQKLSNPEVAAAAAKPPRPPRQRRDEDLDDAEFSAPRQGGNVMRSSTMPKDTEKRAGWFRKKKR